MSNSKFERLSQLKFKEQKITQDNPTIRRHREMGSSPVRLARYALALNAMCMDPRQFHGHDLIGTLQHQEPPGDYEIALTALAACNAQAHVRRRQMRRLLDVAHAAQNHNVGECRSFLLLLCALCLRPYRYFCFLIPKFGGSFGSVGRGCVA